MVDIAALALFVVLQFFVLLIHMVFLTVHIRDVDDEVKELKEKLNQIIKDNSTKDISLSNQFDEDRKMKAKLFEPTEVKVIYKETKEYTIFSQIIKVAESDTEFILTTKDYFERTFYKSNYYWEVT